MWQRLSEYARKAIYYAEEECTKCLLKEIAPEHLLLGMLRIPDSSVAIALNSVGISPGAVQNRIQRGLPKGSDEDSSDFKLAPSAKQVLEQAWVIARAMGDNYVGTHHLLLGIYREGSSLGAKVLVEMDLQVEKFTQAIAAGVEQAAVAKTRPPHSIHDLQFAEKTIISRILEWAASAQNLLQADQSYLQDITRLQETISWTKAELQLNLMLGLCLEINEPGSLTDCENWHKLRLSAEQATALAEIGIEIRKLLTSE